MKEARENFASSSITPLPPLPARPVSRQPSLSRNPRPRAQRKILPADQIFRSESSDLLSLSASQSAYTTPDISTNNATTALTIPEEDSYTVSPPRQRRATITSISPESPDASMDVPGGSPSGQDGRKGSTGIVNALHRPISPLSTLQQELEKGLASIILRVERVMNIIRQKLLRKLFQALPLC